MIKAIFFDFDGVLTHNKRGSTTTIEVIQESNPALAASKIQECYYHFHPELLLGVKNHSDIWNDFCNCIGQEIHRDILQEAFSRTPMNDDMMRLASELAANYRLGIITDNAADRMAFLIGKHGLDTLFNPIVISAAVGKRKDNAELFEYALRLIGHEAGACVFIDNQERNLIVPAALGFKTCFFDTQQNDIQKLKAQLAQWDIQDG
jgi:putative hydrolase of the HAD superfamily